MVSKEEQDRIDQANKTGRFAPKAGQVRAKAPPGTGPQPHEPIPPIGGFGTSGTPVKPEEAAAVAKETEARKRS